MKSLFIFLVVALLYPVYPESEKILGGHILFPEEAVRILGEPCRLIASETTAENGGHQYAFTYEANSSDEQSGRIVALYYQFESFQDEAAAKAIFNTFSLSNQGHEGFERVSDLGDEAFFQSDSRNFYLLIVRKGNEMVRLKVNKITPRTSLPELRKIARAVIQRVS